MATGLTSRLSILYPLGTDAASIATDMQNIAQFCDTNFIPYTQSAATTPPSTTISGSIWWCTNSAVSWFGFNYYNGTAWTNIGVDPVYYGSTTPSTPYTSMVWVNTNTTNPAIQVYNGTSWVNLLPGTNTNGQSPVSSGSGWTLTTFLPLAGGTMSGPIAMGANKITGVANGTAAQDVAAFGQVPVTSNGTCTASVTMTGSPVQIGSIVVPSTGTYIVEFSSQFQNYTTTGSQSTVQLCVSTTSASFVSPLWEAGQYMPQISSGTFFATAGASFVNSLTAGTTLYLNGLAVSQCLTGQSTITITRVA